MSTLGRSPGGPSPKVTVLSACAGAAFVAAGLLVALGGSWGWWLGAAACLVVGALVLRSAVRAASEGRQRYLEGED
jgi:divalent metal cation (Fe/Co/Zn/Cd) transporter